MTQVQNIYKYDEVKTTQDEKNRFEICEEVVADLVEKGIPDNFNPSTFISSVARTYDLNYSEAKTCIQLATKQLKKTVEKDDKQEELNGNSNYFWKTGYSNSVNYKEKNDGMDSLSSLAAYNKLIFLK